MQRDELMEAAGCKCPTSRGSPPAAGHLSLHDAHAELGAVARGSGS
jgi:hypothetical protein